MLGSFFAVAGDAPPVGFGYGVLFWAILVGSGIVKCVSIARRETTSTLCVASLALVLLAHLLSVVLGWAATSMHGPVRVALLGLGAIAVVAAAVVSLTLGIVGLATYRQGCVRDGQAAPYLQGQAQAGWGIGLNVVFALFFLSSVIAGSAARRLAPPHLANGAQKQVHAFEEFNFRLRPPGNRWVEMNAASVMKDSCLVLMQRNPEVYIAVIAEQMGVEAGMSTEKLVGISQANMKSACPGARISPTVPDPQNGLAGQRFGADAEIGRLDLSYEYWCYSGNGYGYQVLMWAGRSDKARLQELAGQVFSGFEQIDPARRHYTAGSKPFGLHASTNFAYSLDLEGSDWCRWENMAETDTLPEVGGRHPGDAWFSVTPVLLPVPGVTADYVRKGLLELYGLTDNPMLSPVEPLEREGLDGCSYSFLYNGKRYVETLMAKPSCAYLLSVWCEEADAASLPQLAQGVLDGLAFSDVGIAPDVGARLSPVQVSDQARMINQIGLVYYNDGRYPEALACFNEAVRNDPVNANFFGNGLAACQQMGRWQEGLAMIEACRDGALLEAQRTRNWQAQLLQGAGRLEEADAVFDRLFAAGYRNDESFTTWTALRSDLGKWDGLDRIFADYAAKSSPVSLRIHQMRLYWKKGDFSKIVDLCKESEAKCGFAPDVAYWAIDAYQELDLDKEALEVCEELLRRKYESVLTYQEKGISEYRLKWHRQAKESLEKALKLNPHNQDTQEWLQIVSAELGEGDNSALKHAIDPVVLPEDLDRQLARAAPADFGAEFGAYYERLLTMWEYEQGKRLRRTDVQRIKLLDDAGVSSFSSLEYDFSPVSQEIFVNRLLVRDGQGEIVSRGVVKDYYVTDDRSDGLVSEDKRLVIPVPGLQVGYSIEIEITRDYPAEPDEFRFGSHYLAAGVPVLNAAVYLAGEPPDVLALGFNGVEPQRLKEGVAWVGTAPCSYRWEPMQLPVERFIPVVVLGPGRGSWEACGKEYLGKIEQRLGSSDAIRGKAGELVAGREGDEEKFRAIVDWIRASFTYQPLEFGRSAYLPDCAADTLSYLYGDCKDLSVLLVKMLEAVGIRAELALVSTSSDLYPEIATTDQFNHMIVWVPGLRGGLFVDPTDQEAEAFLSVPANLQRCQALVLDPQGIRLETIPAYEPGSSAFSIRRGVAVKGDLVELTDRIALRGYCASWMRGVLKEEKKINWVKWFQQNVADFVPNLEVKTVSAENVADNGKELVLEISYLLRHAVRQADGRLAIRMPTIWVGYYLSARPVPDRRNPFRINHPFSMALETEIQPPTGYEPDGAVWPDASGGSLFIDWKTAAESPWSGSYRCTLKPGEHKGARYSDYVSDMDAAVKAARLEFDLVKIPDAAPAATTPTAARM